MIADDEYPVTLVLDARDVELVTDLIAAALARALVRGDLDVNMIAAERFVRLGALGNRLGMDL